MADCGFGVEQDTNFFHSTNFVSPGPMYFRPRLVSMCKLMNIQPYGTDAYLRYSLRTKLGWYLFRNFFVEIVLSASDLVVVAFLMLIGWTT